MDWKFLKSWKRRKGFPRPTQPTDKNANLPRYPTEPDASANLKLPASTSTTAAPPSHQICIEDVEPRDPIRPSAVTVQPTPATAPTNPPPVIEADPAAKTQLWIRAYDAICEDDPKLVSAYEAILSTELQQGPCDTGEGGGDDFGNARHQMDRMVQEGLRRTEKAAAKMNRVHEGMRVASSVKALISTAVKHAPEAAAVWAGICLLFGILENPTSESKALRDGVSHVVSRMDWYWCLSRLLATTQAETTAIRDELKRHVEGLYKKLLSHLMKSVCSFYHGLIPTIARDMIKLDDWADALQSVKDAETLVQQDIDIFHNLEVRTSLNSLSRQARDQQARLQDIYRAIRETDQKQEARQRDEQMKKCLSDLRLTDPRDDMERIADTKGGLYCGASNWILRSDDFRRWREADDAQLLWIKGDPGKGKTMLMITIVEELQRQRRTTPLVLSCFFCQGTDEKLNHAAAVLRGLIYILCDQQPSLASHLHTRYDSAGESLFRDANSFYALSKVLENLLQDERLQRTYLVVDALDECMTDQDQLLRFIASRGMASPRVKWIVSSRNIPKIGDLLKIDSPDGFPGSEVRLSLEVTQNANQVALAVNAFIDYKLSSMSTLRDDHETRIQVRDVMREKANGTFLWVALVVDELYRTDIWDMLEVLKELPEKLEGLYDRMIQQIRSLKRRTPEFCRLVLSAATLAYRPLHLTELATVAGLPAEILDHANRVQHIVALCGSFLTVKENVVYLIHQSVKDYLTERATQTIFPSGPVQVHRTMFARSVQALSNGRLRRNMYALPHLGTTTNDVRALEPDPLAGVRYSCIHWARHFCDIDLGNSRFETEDLDRVERFIRDVFLYWLEALALLQSMSEGIISLRQLETSLKAQSCEGRVMNLISDAVRFALHNRHTIENAPLQAYVSALIFSPTISMIRKEFSREEPQWVNVKPIVETCWSPCTQTLEGHGGSVNSVAFSPDGRQIISGSRDGTIKIWDHNSGAYAQTLEGHDSLVNSVAFSPDGQQVISGSGDGTIKVWDRESGTCAQTLEGHGDWVNSVAFSPDGQQIISGSGDGTIKVWDCDSGTCVQTLEGHAHWVRSVAFSPDGQQILSGSYDCTIKVWDCYSGTCAQTLEGHGSVVSSVAVSPDGQQVISGSRDGTVKVWDRDSGACTQTLEGPVGLARSVAFFMPDGQQIISGSRDGTIKVWDRDSGDAQTLEDHGSVVNSVAFSPDGQRIISGSGNGTIKVWDCDSGACVQTLEGHGVWVNSVAFSPDGQQIISGSYDHAIKVWDCDLGAYAEPLEGHGGLVSSVAFSPDGQQIISGSGDGTVKVWDRKSGACTQTLEGHGEWVNSVAFSPDNQQIASGSYDRTVKVWDSDSGACVQTLEGHESSVNSVAFSPDGQQIISGSRDGTIKAWDHDSGECEQTIECGVNNDILAVEISSTSHLRVLTNGGWIDIAAGLESDTSNRPSIDGDDDEHENESECCYGYGLSTDNQWIYRHKRNILWLPPDYRPSSSAVWCPRHGLTPSDGRLESMVALGCPSGRVIVLGLADDGWC